MGLKELPNKYRFHRNDKRKSGVQGKDIFKPTAQTMDTLDNHPKRVLLVFTQTNMTNTPAQSTKNTMEKSTPETSEKLKQAKSQTLICSVEECHAKHGALRESVGDLMINGGTCGLNVLEYLEQNSLNSSSLKMLKDCSATTRVGV